MVSSTRYWLRQVSTDVVKVGLQQWVRDVYVHYKIVVNTVIGVVKMWSMLFYLVARNS